MLMQSPITDRRTSPPLLSIGPKLLEVADRESDVGTPPRTQARPGGRWGRRLGMMREALIRRWMCGINKGRTAAYTIALSV